MATKVYMRDLSQKLDRSSHTIRGWERDDILPRDLVPHRDEKGWRYWTEAQVTKLEEWMKSNHMSPGKGLSAYKPSEDQVQEMFRKLREPRDIQLVKCPRCGASTKNLAGHQRFAHQQQ